MPSSLQPRHEQILDQLTSGENVGGCEVLIWLSARPAVAGRRDRRLSQPRVARRGQHPTSPSVSSSFAPFLRL
jgi:hypothetical protein